jgi:acyl-CoA synthetase (AMP-forming)/AMP-acid ligase II
MGFHPSLSLLASHCDRRTCLSHASVCSNPITNARENTMVIGIGTDILRTSRLDPSTLVPGDAFFERAFTSTEREQAMHAANRHEYLVARFCAKEAAYKAISLCQEEFHPGDFEILDDEGWLYTGDMAEVRDGFIYLVDRKKDVIISGGENLYPVQIEDFLRSNNAIKDVAVIGLPDARLGEVAAAVIEVKEGMSLTEEEVNNFCLDLPRYKRPRVIIFAPVPRNPTGKIEKPKLREMYCGGSLVAKQVELV